MTATQPSRIDPVTTEIIRCALTNAAEEMNTTLIRSAYTPVIYEGKDCAVALLARDHQVLGQSSGLPIFLGNLEVCTRTTEERFGSGVWQPGDVWLLNDAYIGGTHLNDVTVYAPIFCDRQLVGFAASRAHWLDVGSKDPGGAMDSTSIHQEGLRLGPTKIVEGGVDCYAVQDIIARNLRFPYSANGDMRAQIACARTGQRRLAEIVSRWGRDTVLAARDEIFAQTERLERQRVTEIPDGSYEASGFIDNDGIVLEKPLPVTVQVAVSGDALTIDVTDCADQTPGPVNCGAAQAVSACRVGYKLLISPHIPLNGGSFQPLSTRVREGSTLGATDPAACQWYFSHLGLVIDLIVKALSPAVSDRVAAASYGDSMIVQLFGRNPRSGRDYVSLEATVGGWGAWDGSDGESGLINNVNGSLKDMPIEVFESTYPIRVARYAFRPGSGGAGRWRGGNGVVREYILDADTTLSLWWDRSTTPAWGLFGGADAEPPHVVVNPGRADEHSMLKVNGLQLQAGDVILCHSGGGGGFGDPADRPADEVREDVRQGRIPAQTACERYGLSL